MILYLVCGENLIPRFIKTFLSVKNRRVALETVPDTSDFTLLKSSEAEDVDAYEVCDILRTTIPIPRDRLTL